MRRTLPFVFYIAVPDFLTPIYIYIYTHIYTYIHTYIYGNIYI